MNAELPPFPRRGKKRLCRSSATRAASVIVIIMPIILLLFFGYGVNLDLKHVPCMCSTGKAANRARTCSSVFRPANISASDPRGQQLSDISASYR